jgi:hypothetical protein
MNLNTFVMTYNNTTVGDGQCVALIKLYEDEVLGFIEYFGVPYAYQYFTSYPTNQGLQNHYDRYFFTDGLPAPGDIVVYDSNTGGGAGHVSIVYLNPTSSGFTGFDQNWSTPGKCHIESHTYNHALGFLRPKGSPGPEPPGPTPEEGSKGNYKKWLFSRRKTIFLS